MKLMSFILFLVLITGCEESQILDSAQSKWNLSSSNPIFSLDESPSGFDQRLIWNDPSVLKKEESYLLWISAGLGPENVKIFRFSSNDGYIWKVDNKGNPVLVAGENFDSRGVETPNVIYFNGSYHMYYSFYTSDNHVISSMGHAVSEDGVNWKKLGELTSLTSQVGNMKGNKWGWLSRAEPAALIYKGQYYLYFTDVKCRLDDCSGDVQAVRGISLATSADGHNFTQVGNLPILFQSEHYPASQGWEGYSTPWAMIIDDKVHLFADVFRKVGKESLQQAIVHFSSADGINFTTEENDVIVAGTEEWSASSVRSPTVLLQGDKLVMWYAGDNYKSKAKKVQAGIGVATSTLK